MGYEHRIIFIEGPFSGPDGPFVHPGIGDRVPTVHGNFIMDVDLCCISSGPVQSLITAATEAEMARITEDPDTYAFGFYQGKDFVTTDGCGKPVSPIDVELLNKAAEMENRAARENGEVPYRRMLLLEQICRELVTVPRWSNESIGITALHYGH